MWTTYKRTCQDQSDESTDPVAKHEIHDARKDDVFNERVDMLHSHRLSVGLHCTHLYNLQSMTYTVKTKI